MLTSEPHTLHPSIPADARILQLRDGAKEPAGLHGHLHAVPLVEFAQVGQNIGIALDGQFILVDVDRPDAGSAGFLLKRLEQHPTWKQRSRRGPHFLFRIPAGARDERGEPWVGTNAKMRDDAGTPYADVRTRGYVVGPGSMVAGHLYAVEDPRDPVEAPAWLLELCKRPAPGAVGEERPGIAAGEHDDFLIAAAGWLRGRYGLSAQALTTVLPGLLPALEDYDESRPYTDTDFTRIARSAAKYAPAPEGPGLLADAAWENGMDVSLVGPPDRWWIDGFLPRGELVMLFGKGKTGKSSFGSWLAREVTMQGGTFVFYGVEEPFRRFLRRAVLAGAERSLIYGARRAASISFPRDAKKLEDAVRLARADVIYIDSIMAHMDATSGLNIAERTRKSLAPLAEIAQTTGAAIVCVFHENKAGEYLGSVEMLNVARHVLKARRRPGGPLQIKVSNTNLEEPQIVLQFDVDEKQIVEPHTGEVQQRWTPEGLQPATARVLRQIESLDIETADEEADDAITIAGPPRGPALRKEIAALLRADASLTREQIATATGAPPATVKRYLGELRRGVGEQN